MGGLGNPEKWAGTEVEIMEDFDSELQLLTNLYESISIFDQLFKLCLYQLNRYSLVNT